jgi:nucleoside-diphosphate-sugar epimerase
MKILVTGAAGFLGKRIVLELVKHGQTDLRAIVRQPSQVAANSACELVGGNLMSLADMINATRGIDLVIHAAAGTKGAAADMFANSVIGTRNLMNACRENKVRRVLLVSSFSVYDTSNIPTGSTVSEVTPIEKNGVSKGVYAYTKTQQEHLFTSTAAEYGIESIVIRPGVIFGPGSAAMSPRVGISAMGWFAKLGGANLLPLTYVDNCAEAIVIAALQGTSGQSYNITDDDLPTCGDYFAKYQKAVKKTKNFPMPGFVLKAAVGWLERYAKRSHGQLPAVLNSHIVKSQYRPFSYDNSKMKALGWAPKVTMDQALQNAFDSMKKL